MSSLNSAKSSSRRASDSLNCLSELGDVGGADVKTDVSYSCSSAGIGDISLLSTSAFSVGNALSKELRLFFITLD